MRHTRLELLIPADAVHVGWAANVLHKCCEKASLLVRLEREVLQTGADSTYCTCRKLL
jgi:hypothetical protein